MMRLFKSFDENISYKDILQLDGAFSVCHINYGNSPSFNNIDGKSIAVKSRKNSISTEERIDDVSGTMYSFDGTEENLDKKDKVQLWETYWLEYINSFDKLTKVLPKSIVTIYVGRQTIELGIKYLLIKKDCFIPHHHDLKELSDLLYTTYKIKDEYMEYVNSFCESYWLYIEGGNPEYFRFPAYKKNKFFAGNKLDISWLSYNFALIILKLIHFAKLEETFITGRN